MADDNLPIEQPPVIVPPDAPNVPETETRDVLDIHGTKTGELTLLAGTDESVWTAKLADLAYQTPALTMNQIISAKVQAAVKFGNALMGQAVIENIGMGITQAGKTKAVSDYCANLQVYLQQGSLYAAIDELNALLGADIPAELSPFITSDRLTAYKTKINVFLGS